MDTSNITDTYDDPVNETNGNIETEGTEEPELANVKQSITPIPSSIFQKKQPAKNVILEMDTSNITDICEDSVNETNDNIETEDTDGPEVADVKQSITPKTSSISQKKQPDQLCNCPLHCDTKIGKEWREKIYKQFGELGDHSLQNVYIQRHIKIKSIAKRLWEDEIIDKKIQRRVTCKYLIPLTGSVKESYSYAKTLNYETAKFALDTSIQENAIKVNTSTNTPKENGIDKAALEAFTEPQISDIEMKEVPQCNGNATDIGLDLTVKKISEDETATKENGDVCRMELDETTESKIFENCSSTKSDSTAENNNSENGSSTKSDSTAQNKNSVNGSSIKSDSTAENKTSENGSSTKENISDVNSPSSFNDNESINTAEESNISELDNTACSSVKYVDVCQKAFMNMYGITEKRIRWQREKLILRSRYLAEKQKKELEEMDRTLSLARSLGAGCQPLFAFLENSEYKPLAEQLLIAIEDDVMLVNNFFHNQLWKPEDIMNKSIHFSTTLDSCETECD